MRNGNELKDSSNITEISLFILPMRNGGGGEEWKMGEEWKRLRGKIFKECRKAFYPTYEE